jgi:hypothetical protein
MLLLEELVVTSELENYKLSEELSESFTMIVATVVELMKRRILNPRVGKDKATLAVSLGLRPAR